MFSAIHGLVILLVATVLLFIRKTTPKRPKGFPDGPMTLPFVGAYFSWLAEDWNFPHFTVEKWSRKYGRIFGFYAGSYGCVVVTGNELVRQVLNSTDFDGRLDALAARLRALDQQLGILFVDGPFWKEQRRFSLRHMRDFGHGRRFPQWEMHLEQDVADLIQTMKTTPKPWGKAYIRDNGQVAMPDLFYPLTLMAILRIFGPLTHFDADDYETFHIVGKSTVYLHKNFFALGGALSIFPWTRHFAPKLTGFSGILEHNKTLMGFCKKYVKKAIDQHERGNRDTFLDIYIDEMLDRNDSTTGFFEDQLIVLVVDYIFPAISTVAVTLANLFRFLAYYPEVQGKVREEICRVVGQGRLPNLNDRQNLPYTEATLRESMRRETLIPLGVPHRAMTDSYIGSKFIPKDTMVVTSLWGANMDPEAWGDPENFRPERFLNANGDLLRKDLSLPFSGGKRVCAGETYSRNILFVVYSGLVQNFVFSRPTIGLDAKSAGMVNTPSEDFWLMASEPL